MYRFKWPLCKKSAVLVLVWCYKARCDREQDLWSYWLTEGCIKHWCDKPSGYGFVSKKYEQGEHVAVTFLYLVPCSSCLTYIVKKTRFETLCSTPLTGICSDTAVRSLLAFLFHRSLSSPVINICSCFQDLKLSWIGPKEYHPHIGFITANFLHIWIMNIAGL